MLYVVRVKEQTERAFAPIDYSFITSGNSSVINKPLNDDCWDEFFGYFVRNYLLTLIHSPEKIVEIFISETAMTYLDGLHEVKKLGQVTFSPHEFLPHLSRHIGLEKLKLL